ncbi:RsiV family protein [Aquimarina sp. 2201CG1-2-11]|uniref:RsiV family protein n=1 Tax=Aquimarina discodermiae TaxID=3231043 RepID=UPI003462B0A0
MRTIITCLFLLFVIACNKRNNNENRYTETSEEVVITEQEKNATFSEENLELDKEKTKAIKRQQLVNRRVKPFENEDSVIAKELYKEHNHYILDYRYPYIDEEKNPGFSVFNNYIKEVYLNIIKTGNQILEDKELLCDTLKIKKLRDKRIMDYRVHASNRNFLSIVMYRENYYFGMKHSVYTFDCLNFDAKKYQFMYYQDFFRNESEEELFLIINTTISNAIREGELYYDCWELSEGDFKAYKNNFVINEDSIEFYFDDCVICPSYTGMFSVKIPISTINHLLKKDTDNFL